MDASDALLFRIFFNLHGGTATRLKLDEPNFIYGYARQVRISASYYYGMDASDVLLFRKSCFFL